MSAEPRIILHVGVHKTGTSAIQITLWRNRGNLRDDGVLYPLAGCPADPSIQYGHHEIPWSVLGRSVSSPRLFEDLEEEISKSGAGTTVLSSEEFDRLDDLGAKAVLDRLAGSKKVIFYYRRQSDVLQGLYGTEICFNGELRSISDFATAVESELNYLALARRWAKLVGRDNLMARPYLRSDFPNRNVVSDFLSALAIPPGPISVNDSYDENESLPWFAALRIQAMWKAQEPRSRIYQSIRSLRKVFRGQRKTYQFLSPSQRKTFDARFAEGNRVFMREFSAGTGDLFPVDDRESDQDWKARREEEHKTARESLDAVVGKLPVG